MQSEIYLQKTPKRFLFQKVQPDLKTELWALHTLDSVSTVCICPHPNATVSEISTFKSMCDQLTHTTGFFLMQEAFQDHTAFQLAMERVRGLQSTVHMWLPTSAFYPDRNLIQSSFEATGHAWIKFHWRRGNMEIIIWLSDLTGLQLQLLGIQWRSGSFCSGHCTNSNTTQQIKSK